MLAYLAGVQEMAPAMLDDQRDPDYMRDTGVDQQRPSQDFEQRHGHFGAGQEGTERYGFADETGINSAYHHAYDREEHSDQEPDYDGNNYDRKRGFSDDVLQDLDKAQFVSYQAERDDEMDPDAPPPMPEKQKQANVARKQRLYGGYGD